MVQRSTTSVFQLPPPFYRRNAVSNTLFSQVLLASVDQLDGDQLIVDWTPSNYTPSTLPAEADAIDQLTAHLAGIDSAFGGAIVGAVPSIVANIAARDALTPSTGEQAFVTDASADGDVPSGSAMYIWDGAAWQRIATSDASADNLPLGAASGALTLATTVDGALVDLFGNDADFRSALGLADGDTDMGSFSGSTLTDGSDLRTLLQELETAVEGVVAGGASIFVVADIATRNALTPSLGDLARVTDASADVTVDNGGALYVYDGGAWVKAASDETMAEAVAMRASLGTASGASDMGSFPGGTITTGATVYTALSELETAVEAVSAGSSVSVVATIAARNLLTPSTGDISYVSDASADATITSGAATYVYDGAAWQKVADSETAAESEALRTLSGTAEGDTDLGVLPGSIVSDGVTIHTAIGELEAAIEASPSSFVVANIAARDVLTVSSGDIAYVTDASADPLVDSGDATYLYDGATWRRIGNSLASSEAADLRTLTGTAAGATVLPAFGGSTITTGTDIVGALGELETAVESHATVSVVTTISARDALAPQQADLVYVTDASADPSVASGAAWYVYDGAAWQKLSDAETTSDADAMRSTLGTSLGASDLGAFPGGVITDNVSVFTALSELESAHETLATSVTQGNIVATIAARDALTPSTGDAAYVVDASSDATVTTGAAYYIYDGGAWQKVSDAETASETDSLRTLSGVAAGVSVLPAFAGSTITTGTDVVTALGELETAVEAAVAAAAEPTSEVVANIAARDALTPASGDLAYVSDASADPDLTSGAASYVYDGGAWQRVSDDETEAEGESLRTLTGTSLGDDDLGAFPGNTITTGQTIHGALGELEAAFEASPASDVVANIAARDALTASTGDVAHVVDASADAGVTSGAATYIYDGAVWQRVAAAEDGTENDALRTSLGTTAGDTDMGSFSGSTLTDGSDLRTLLQELETAIEGSVNITSAAYANIAARNLAVASVGDIAQVTDASGDATVTSGSATYIFDGGSWIKVADAETETEATNLRTLSGTPGGATNLGAFAGAIITDNTDVVTALGELEAATEAAATAAGTSVADAGALYAGATVETALQEVGQDAADLRTLSGTADGATALGAFSGSTITTGGTITAALQELETAVESAGGSGANVVVNIAARNALTPAVGDIAYVADASGDATVGSGAATYVYDGGTWQKVAEAETDSEASDLRTLTGTSAGATALPAFAGSTITTGTDVVTALGELETAVETADVAATAAATAAGTSVADAGALYAGATVEAALQEVGQDAADLRTLSGTADGATVLPAFPGSTITTGGTIVAALTELETAIEAGSDDQTAAEVSIADAGALYAGATVEDALQEVGQDTADIRSLSGTADGTTVLPAFSGSTITTGGTMVAALQELETAVEAAGGSTGSVVFNIAARDALTASSGDVAYVVDASGDATVDSGAATYIFDGVSWLKVSEAETSTETAALRTSLGTSAGDTDMGSFSGSTLTDGSDLRTLLQEIETAIEGGSSITASIVANIAARNLLTPGTGDLAQVTDASGDATVNSGAATYIFDGGSWVKIADAETESETDALRTLSGTATGASVLPAFAGSTITTGTDVVGALGELETAVETADAAATAAATAAGTSVADAGALYAGATVEAALQEVGQDAADIRTTMGTADGLTHLGAFAGSTITSNTDVVTALGELETAVEAADTAATAAATAAGTSVADAGALYAGATVEAALQEVGQDAADIRTLSGTADGATALPAFPGSTITTGGTIVAALTEIETATEAASTAATTAATAAGTSVADAGALYAGATVEAALQEVGQDAADLRTLSGTVDGATAYPAFPGSTITTGVTTFTALSELEAAIEAGSDDQTAAEVSITDAGTLYTGTDVEAALQEVGQDAADIRTLSGTADGATVLSAFSGSTITTGVTITAALQELETATEAASASATAAATAAGTSVADAGALYAGATVEAALQEVGQDAADLRTLTGTADGATDLGAFSGTTLTSNSDLRTLLQELETAVEAASSTGSAGFIAANIAARNLLTPSLGDLAHVTDASGDATVATGAATYIWDGAAWQKIAEAETVSEADDLRTLSGTAVSATDLGTFAGAIITDNTDVVTALGELEAATETAATAAGTSVADAGALYAGATVEAALQEVGQDAADLRALSGTADGATVHSAFPGSTLSTGITTFAALGELEAAVEAIPGASVVADITARDALTPGTGARAYVTDASADGTVTSGAAMYIWDGAAWQKISEVESLDLIAASLSIADVGALFSGGNVEAALQEVGQDTADIRTLSGTADGATVLPGFSGSTITTGVTIVAALQELETAIEAGSDDQTAVEVSITDAGGLYTGTEVEAALQEVGQDAADLRTLSGTADGDTVLGAFSGTTITTGVTITAALQELETATEAAATAATAAATAAGTSVADAGALYAGATVEAALQEVGQDAADLRTLTGTSDGATDLGSFSGSTLTANSNLRTLLQELETAVEGVSSSGASVVVNIAARDALTPATGDFAYVSDASGDATIASGHATYVYDGGSWQKVADAETDSETEDLRTLSGVAVGTSVLPAFSGSTITTGGTLVAALQELETAVEAGTDDQTAAEVNITDAGGLYTGTEVETALQEVGQDAADLRTTMGTADGLTHLGAFGGSTITSNTDVVTALGELETAVEAAAASATAAATAAGTSVADAGALYAGATVEVALQEVGQDAADLRTLSGTADGATALSAFSGSTITTGVTITAALQELETATEAAATAATAAATAAGTSVADAGALYAGATVEAALQEVGQDAADLRSLTGTADGATVLGAFSGTTITTGGTITAALQELETAVEAVAGSTAATTSITDAGALYTGTDVEAALQEVGQDAADIRTLSGTADGATNLGTFAGAIITDNTDVVTALGELEAATETAATAAGTSVADAGALYAGATVEAALQEVGQDAADIRALTGTADGATVLGAFSGSTITTGGTITAALQELETAVEAGTDDQTAAEVNITDAGGLYTGTEVETALQEVGQDAADIRALTGTADGATVLGAFSGSTITTGGTITAALQELETAVEAGTDDQTAAEVNITDAGTLYAGATVEAALQEVGQDAADIRSLTGTADGATVLGAFSGTTITTGGTITAALQELETAVEAVAGSTAATTSITDAGALYTGTDVEAALQEVGQDAADIRTLTGTADGATNLGTFAGATITDNTDVVTALGELEAATEAAATAAGTSVADAGALYAGATVEAALQEVGQDAADIRALTGTTDGATVLGAFSGSTITTGGTITAALQELETAVEAGTDDQTAAEVNITDAGGLYTGTEVETALQEVGQDAADLRTLSGTADGATNLGTFTGATITDNVTLTAALQELETALEAITVPSATAAAPLISDGAAGTVGVSADYARADHVHPAYFTTVDTKASGTYTTVDGDFGHYIRVDNDVTIHLGSTAPIGSEIQIRYIGGGTFTCIPAGGVTLNGADQLNPNESLSVKKVAANEFDLTGGL